MSESWVIKMVGRREAADQQPLLKGSGTRVFPSASERENGSLMLRMERRIIGSLHP